MPQVTKPGFVVFLKAFVITASKTYPFILLVSTLSSIDQSEVVPCGEQHSCLVVKLFGDDYVPSTIKFGSNPFLKVVNGDAYVNNDEQLITWCGRKFLPPRCPGKSKTEMEELCASSETRQEIRNTMKMQKSAVAYVLSIVGWFSFNLLHDWLLLCGVSESITLQVGLASLAFQHLAVAAGFLWSMGAVEVFVAPISGATCGCYYKLGEKYALLAIATPAILYVLCTTKIDTILHAAVNGDFLYFMQYDIPHYLVTQSISDPSNSYLVATTSGARTAERRPDISLRQMRDLQASFMGVNFLFAHVVQNSSIAIAVGPVVQRLMVLAIEGHNLETWYAPFLQILIWCSVPLLVICATLATRAHFEEISAHHGAFPTHLSGTFWEWRLGERVAFVTQALLGSICSWLAALTLIPPLLTVVLGGTVASDANTAFRWSLAGCAGFLFAVYPVYHSMLHPGKLAFTMKARIPWPPHQYLKMRKYPQFGLSKEFKVAETFLERRKREDGERSAELNQKYWQKEWEKELGCPTVFQGVFHSVWWIPYLSTGETKDDEDEEEEEEQEEEESESYLSTCESKDEEEESVSYRCSRGTEYQMVPGEAGRAIRRSNPINAGRGIMRL